jgi:PAS domain S-box-containing protein
MAMSDPRPTYDDLLAQVARLEAERTSERARSVEAARAAERELAVSARSGEERLRLALEAANAGMWEWDLRTNENYWSENLWPLYGLEPHGCEPSYAAWAASIHPDDRAAVEAAVGAAATGGTDLDVEWRVHPGAGAERWLMSRGRPRRDEAGAVVMYLGIVIDVTERRRADLALRETQSILQAALDQSTAGIAIAEAPSGRLRYVNDAGLLIRGGTRASVVEGVGLDQYVASWQILDLDGAPLAPDAVPLARAVRFGEKSSREFIIRRAPGDDRTVLARAAPITDAQGRVTAGVVVFLDVTEAKAAERALQESERRFRRAIEEATFPIMIHAEDGEVLALSRTWTELTGYAHADIPTIAAWTQQAYGPRQQAVVEVIRDLYALEGRGDEGEYVIRCKDGSLRTWDFSSIGLGRLPDSRRIALSMAADVTERKRAEAERARLEGQLQQAHKMESVGRLAGGIAHDFNNMLGVILGHADLALEHLDLTAAVRSDLEEIQRAAKRSADLTRQLLGFARKQTVAPVVVDLNATMEGMLKMLQRLLGEAIDLDWRPGAALWPVRIDPSQVDQILANLCVNSRDAIQGAGRMTIETGNVAVDEGYCANQPEASPGEYVRLTVSDDGSGMDKETLSHLFEPFFTTKGQGRGTGLGLATLYGVVKQNGGFINVYSEPGVGTTFTIYLPRHQGQARFGAVEAPARPTQPGHETILVVEDEPGILRVAKRMLEEQGYRVLTASTPGEGLRLAAEHPERIHLLLTDVVLPEMNGRDLAKSLLAQHPHLKRLFMSGYTANVIAHQGVLAEGVNFIQKPFSSEGLARAVRAALDAKSAFSELP